MEKDIKQWIKKHNGGWEKLIYESGFVNYGRKSFGGWEYTYPINPKMNDNVIKSIKVEV